MTEALADAGVSGTAAHPAVVARNTAARLDGLRSALIMLAILALVALFFSGGVPEHQPRDTKPDDDAFSLRQG